MIKMSENKLINKILQNRRDEQLPYGFNDRVMRQVYIEAERKSRRSYVKGILLISIVSLFMAVSGVVVLKSFFNISLDLSFDFLNWKFSNEDLSAFLNCSYIGFLALILLMIDMLLRKRKSKMEIQE